MAAARLVSWAFIGAATLSCGGGVRSSESGQAIQSVIVAPDASAGVVDANANPGTDADASDPNDQFVCVPGDASTSGEGGVTPNDVPACDTTLASCGGGQVAVPAVGNGHVCCKVRHCNDEGQENGCFLASVYQNDCQRWFHLPPPYPASTGVVADRDCVDTDLAASGCLFVAPGGFPADVTLICGVPACAPRMPWGTVR
jgi:hypothetical protein